MTAADREKACSDFDTANLGYARHMDVDHEMMMVMFDGDGEPVAMSRAGITPLLSYAANHGIALLTRH